MSRRIRKYPLEIEPVQTLQLPAHPRQILDVRWHRGDPCLWVLGDNEVQIEVEIRCYKTGYGVEPEVDEILLDYLGSAMEPPHQVLWHYFEKR